VTTESSCPDLLYHYYESARGPFLNLSDLPLQEAELILERIRREGVAFASKRAEDYLHIRKGLEEKVRQLFIAKGGRPERANPHYLVLGPCPWLLGWYQDGRKIHIPLAIVPAEQLSFTYGDTFPAMRFKDDMPWRGQVYTLAEIPEIIRRYGLPQEWNRDGRYGPDRYIEAQVWSDRPVASFLQANNLKTQAEKRS
jgi:hypothetical protein